MATPDDLITTLAEKNLSGLQDRIWALEGNDYYRPIDVTGATSNPPTQGEMDSLFGTPASFKSNMVGLIKDTTNSRNWIVFGDQNDWYPIQTGLNEAPSDNYMYARRNGAWVSGGYAFQNNIGIGTTPNYPLHVNGNIRADDLNSVGYVQIAVKVDVNAASDFRFYRAVGSNVYTRWILRANTTTESGSNAGCDFQIINSNDTGTPIATALFIKRSSYEVGMGNITSPNAILDIGQPSSIYGKPTLGLVQSDLSEEFINFKATVGTGNPIDTAAVGTYYGKVRVSVNGTFKYMALYNS